jgi:hypothetical protein
VRSSKARAGRRPRAARPGSAAAKRALANVPAGPARDWLMALLSSPEKASCDLAAARKRGGPPG